jgi:hypothetical protein
VRLRGSISPDVPGEPTGGRLLALVFSLENTMAVKKIAISVPEDVVAAVDRAAEERGLTRSRFISDVLRQVAGVRTDAELSRKINEVFADPEIAREQRDTAERTLRARPDCGDEW